MLKFYFMQLKDLSDRLKFLISHYKFTLIGAFAILLSAVFIALLTQNDNKSLARKKSRPEIVDCDRRLFATAPITPERFLNDKNDIQNIHAQINGLERIYINNASFVADSANLAREHVLIRLKDNRFYHVKDLTHSFPYATPEMVDLLNEIGNRFYLKLKEKNLGYYRFLVTSALRTNESQSDLSSRNRNASSQSAHLYGATIDITYKEFFNVKSKAVEQHHLVADALKQVMLDLREECRLLVVRERRQAVYHFTVVNCDPTKSTPDNMTRKVLEY